MVRMIVVVAVAAGVLGGCQTTAEGLPPLPDNYRQAVAAQVRETFFDPYSIRDARISAPTTGVTLFGPVRIVCVQANAKNRFGAYIGLHDTAFVYQSGRFITAERPYSIANCRYANYGPFPEIDAGAAANPERESGSLKSAGGQPR